MIATEQARYKELYARHHRALKLQGKRDKTIDTLATSWRMDETYVKVKGKWVYLYRAVDKFVDTIDFTLFEQRDEMAATTFFKQAINNNGFPHKVVMDKSGANYAGLENINMLLMLAGLISFIEIYQVKYLNNLIEQDHRFIKKGLYVNRSGLVR